MGTLCPSKGILHDPKWGSAELLLMRVHTVVVWGEGRNKAGWMAGCHKPRGQPGTILPWHGKGGWPQRACAGLPEEPPHYTGPFSERLNSRSLCNIRGEQTHGIKVKQHNISLQRALREEPVQVSFGKGSLHNTALPNCSSNSELIILSLSWVFFSSLPHINCS